MQRDGRAPIIQDVLTASSIEARTGDRIPALDGIRGLAVLLILWTHFGVGGDITYPGLAGKIFFGVRTIGWAGVDLFFVLSGFLITGILCNARENPHYFRNFYMRRTLRIFPLYFGVLLAVFVILPLVRGSRLGHPSNQIWLWLYCSNFYHAFTGGYAGQPNAWGLAFGHFWSLAVEEHFYLLWPLIVYLCDDRKLVQVCLTLAIMALVLRTSIAIAGGSPYFMTPCRIDAIAMGGVVAVLIRGKISRSVLSAVALWVMVLSGVGLLALYPKTHWDPTLLPMTSLGYSLIGMLFAGMLAKVVLGQERGSILTHAYCNRVLRTLGKYSYGIYVFHGLFLNQINNLVLPLDWLHEQTGMYVVSAFLHFLAASSTCFFIAWLSWHAYEKHFLRLKHFFESPGTLQSATEIAFVDPAMTIAPDANVVSRSELSTKSPKKVLGTQEKQ